MNADQIKDMLATVGKPNQSTHTTITVKGPKGEEQMFIVRDTTTEEYYKIVDGISAFKYEIDKGRRAMKE